MKHLVFLDAQAGELEKILSGLKSMVVKEFDPAQATAYPVNPGDSLYFLRDNGHSSLRVKATVARVLILNNICNGDLTHDLKEMQPRLQFTEDQYNFWSAKKHVLLVEFGYAHKIDVIQLAANKLTDKSDWIAFEDFDRLLNQE